MAREYIKTPKNAKKTQKMAQKFTFKRPKPPENRLHWEPTFPCYTEAHLENQGAYSLRSLTAPWFSRWASVTFLPFPTDTPVLENG